MWDCIKAFFVVFIFFCAVCIGISEVKGGDIESSRPLNEPAYGWYEWNILHAEDKLKLIEYEMGLSIAQRNGALTESEYDTLYALAERQEGAHE